MVSAQGGPNDALALQLSNLSGRVAALERRDVLQNASIGAGGLTVSGGGSIRVVGGGTITLDTGSFTAGTIQANTALISLGNMTANGSVITNHVTSNNELRGADLYATNAPSFNITGGRVAAWLETATGRLGMATSSERFKAEIRRLVDAPDFDPLSVLELDVMLWSYRAEVARRDDPYSENYVGPDYHVATNFGPIVEHAHALGLWMIVLYEADPIIDYAIGENGDVTIRERGLALRLGEDGEPIPFGFHDALFGYLLQVAVKTMRQEQLRDRRLLLALYRARNR